MKDLFRLDNKVAIVTGGAKGIGRSVVETFLQQGAIVHFLDIDNNAASELLNVHKKAHQKLYYHACDLTNHDLVGATFEAIAQQSGGLDILVNNAGVACIGNVETTTLDDMDRQYQINVKSVYSCLHFGVAHMKASGGGVIVNLASIASVIGLADRFAYSMSKGAVYTMTFSVAKDYVNEGIRCNAVGPARIHTPFVDGYLRDNFPGSEEEMFHKLSKTQPIGRMGQPTEVAHLITYLCSDEAQFVTGSFYPIDGGFITLNT